MTMYELDALELRMLSWELTSLRKLQSELTLTQREVARRVYHLEAKLNGVDSAGNALEARSSAKGDGK